MRNEILAGTCWTSKGFTCNLACFWLACLFCFWFWRRPLQQGWGRAAQKIKEECILACLFLRFHCLLLNTSVRRGSLPLVSATEFFWRTQQAESKHEDQWLFASIFAWWFFQAPLQGRVLTGQVLIHQKGKPPTGVCCSIFLRNKGGWKQTWRIKIY